MGELTKRTVVIDFLINIYTVESDISNELLGYWEIPVNKSHSIRLTIGPKNNPDK